MFDLQWETTETLCIYYGTTLIHRKMQQDDRHRIKIEINEAFSNNNILTKSKFYKYIFAHLNKIAELLRLPHVNSLWAIDQTIFKGNVKTYMCDCAMMFGKMKDDSLNTLITLMRSGIMHTLW